MTGDGNRAILRCCPRMKSFMTCIRVCMMMKMCSGLCKHTTRLKSTFLCLPQNTRKYMYFYIEIMACAFFLLLTPFFKWVSWTDDQTNMMKVVIPKFWWFWWWIHQRKYRKVYFSPLRFSMAQLLSKGQYEIAMGLPTFIQLSQKK